jgi:hypothetical protein
MQLNTPVREIQYIINKQVSNLQHILESLTFSQISTYT